MHNKKSLFVSNEMENKLNLKILSNWTTLKKLVVIFYFILDVSPFNFKDVSK